MIEALSDKTKQFFFVLIKLSIVFGAFYFIYHKLTTNPELNFNVFIEFLRKNAVFSTKNLLFLLLLSYFNWFLEILKWKNLVEIIQPITLLDASKQSLSALTASLITPNRVGDYAVKTAYYSAHQRRYILLLNLVSNMAQMSSTLIFGSIGFVLFIKTYNPNFAYFKMFLFVTLLFILGSLFLFGLKRASWSIRGFSIKRIFILEIPKVRHLKNLGFSILRYIIFSFQFYFLLLILGANLSYEEAMITISSLYLLSSIIPSIFIFDVVIKGGVALYLFGFVGVNNLTVLSTITLMWILNFVLPSIFGTFYVLSFKRNTAAPIIQNSKAL